MFFLNDLFFFLYCVRNHKGDCQGWCVLLGCFAHAPLKWTYLFWGGLSLTCLAGYCFAPCCKRLLALLHLCCRKLQVWLPDRAGLCVAAFVEALTGVEYHECFLTCVKPWTYVLQSATVFEQFEKICGFFFFFLNGAHEMVRKWWQVNTFICWLGREWFLS